MNKSTRRQLLALGFACTMAVALLDAQTAPTGVSSAAEPSVPAAQAPDEATKKITDLVHAGKYAEAQKLTEGLLIAYPEDQRLIKAKALIENLLAPNGSTSAAPGVTAAQQPAPAVNAEQLTGMDKVDYNALIVLARHAQQTTDLDEQNRLLHQFLDQSTSFLEKHPSQILLWQLRVTAAISLNEPTIGYQAGQQLLALGAADSNDPALQTMLGELKNRGWLDKQNAAFEERRKKFAWLLGTWNVNWKWWWGDMNGRDREEFVLTESGIAGYILSANGTRNSEPDFKITISDSGDLKWETFMPPADTGEMYVFRLVGTALLVDKLVIGRRSDPGGYFGNHRFDHGLLYVNDTGDKPFYPSGWQPVVSSSYDGNTQILAILVRAQEADPEMKSKFLKEYPVRLIFSRTGIPPEKQAPANGYPGKVH